MSLFDSTGAMFLTKHFSQLQASLGPAFDVSITSKLELGNVGSHLCDLSLSVGSET